MDPEPSAQMEIVDSPVQPDSSQRHPRPLHRVPSKQLGSGSGAALWLSGTNASAEPQDGSKANADGQLLQVHDPAKSQVATSPVKRASKLYHFPATLARGLRFLNPESTDNPAPDNAQPVAKLQEHNLLRMTSKEELEQTVDLDLSFDFVSTAERPAQPAAGPRSHQGKLDLQDAFEPVNDPSTRKISIDSTEEIPATTAMSTPTSVGRASPGRGMAATNWSARAAKQPPLPLDLSATNPAKLSGASSAQARPRASSRATRPSVDVGRSDSLRAASTPQAEIEPQFSDSVSFISHQSKDSRSSRNSRAPPTLPPTGPLPPVPDGTASKHSSQSSRAALSPRYLDHEQMNLDDHAKEEDQEELRDTDESDGREQPTKKRESNDSTYSGESGDSFQTAGIASTGNSSADNISSSGSQFAAVVPLPTVPSVIWKQRQQRIERQVAAAATTRASAVPATFAIKYPKPPGVDIVPLGPQISEESPRISFGFQSPNPGQLQRWSSIPSQLAALVAAADGPIKPTEPSPTQEESIISARRDLVSSHPNTHLAVVDTPTTESSSPFSPLFSDPGTAFSAATTMSRNSTQSSADTKADTTRSTAADYHKVGEDTADQTVVPGQVHTRHTSTTTVAVLTSDSEVEGDEARARRRRLPMHISTASESDHGSRHASMLDLRASAARSGPWPHSPLLLTPDQSRASRDLLSTGPSIASSAETARMQRATELNSMLGVGLGLDLGLGSELEEPTSGHVSLALPGEDSMTTHNTGTTLHRVKSDSGLASQRRRSESPHVEIDMSLFGETKPGVAPLAVKDFGRIVSAAVPQRNSTSNTPSTLPMLSPRPLSSPYVGRVGMEISTNSSVDAFACNVTPPMPSAAFPERAPTNVQRAGERKSESHLLTSSWIHQAHNVGTRLSYRIAHASWLPTHILKSEHPVMDSSARPAKEKQSPLPSPTPRFEDGAVDGPIARRSSVASASMRRRRSTATVNWGPNVGSARSVPPTVASSQNKSRKQPVIFGNAAFNAPARTPATTNMLPGGTLLSKSLFYAGFCGMPWLWLVGGWWLGPDGMLACTSVGRVGIYEDESDSDSDGDSDGGRHEDWDMVGIDEATSKPVHDGHAHDHTDAPNYHSAHLHPNSAALHRDGSVEAQSAATSPTRSGTMSSNDREESPTNDVPLSRAMVPKAKKSESLMQFYEVAVHQEWEGLEQYVRYNRVAALIGSCVVFTAFVLAIWGIARNW